CTKGNNELSFFTMPEFENWMAKTPDAKNWKVKYYKGLGTLNTKEAKQYFKNLKRHKKPFAPMKE
ncbi:6434_t:CDS:2, partial [Funneliformis geosporum]